jgi:hypothetical protein
VVRKQGRHLREREDEYEVEQELERRYRMLVLDGSLTHGLTLYGRRLRPNDTGTAFRAWLRRGEDDAGVV